MPRFLAVDYLSERLQTVQDNVKRLLLFEPTPSVSTSIQIDKHDQFWTPWFTASTIDDDDALEEIETTLEEDIQRLTTETIAGLEPYVERHYAVNDEVEDTCSRNFLLEFEEWISIDDVKNKRRMVLEETCSINALRERLRNLPSVYQLRARLRPKVAIDPFADNSIGDCLKKITKEEMSWGNALMTEDQTKANSESSNDIYDKPFSNEVIEVESHRVDMKNIDEDHRAICADMKVGEEYHAEDVMVRQELILSENTGTHIEAADVMLAVDQAKGQNKLLQEIFCNERESIMKKLALDDCIVRKSNALYDFDRVGLLEKQAILSKLKPLTIIENDGFDRFSAGMNLEPINSQLDASSAELFETLILEKSAMEISNDFTLLNDSNDKLALEWPETCKLACATFERIQNSVTAVEIENFEASFRVSLKSTNHLTLLKLDHSEFCLSETIKHLQPFESRDVFLNAGMASLKFAVKKSSLSTVDTEDTDFGLLWDPWNLPNAMTLALYRDHQLHCIQQNHASAKSVRDEYTFGNDAWTYHTEREKQGFELEVDSINDVIKKIVNHASRSHEKTSKETGNKVLQMVETATQPTGKDPVNHFERVVNSRKQAPPIAVNDSFDFSKQVLSFCVGSNSIDGSDLIEPSAEVIAQNEDTPLLSSRDLSTKNSIIVTTSSEACGVASSAASFPAFLCFQRSSALISKALTCGIQEKVSSSGAPDIPSSPCMPAAEQFDDALAIPQTSAIPATSHTSNISVINQTSAISTINKTSALPAISQTSATSAKAPLCSIPALASRPPKKAASAEFDPCEQFLSLLRHDNTDPAPTHKHSSNSSSTALPLMQVVEQYSRSHAISAANIIGAQPLVRATEGELSEKEKNKTVCASSIIETTLTRPFMVLLHRLKSSAEPFLMLLRERCVVSSNQQFEPLMSDLTRFFFNQCCQEEREPKDISANETRRNDVVIAAHCLHELVSACELIVHASLQHALTGIVRAVHDHHSKQPQGKALDDVYRDLTEAERRLRIAGVLHPKTARIIDIIGLHLGREVEDSNRKVLVLMRGGHCQAFCVHLVQVLSDIPGIRVGVVSSKTSDNISEILEKNNCLIVDPSLITETSTCLGSVSLFIEHQHSNESRWGHICAHLGIEYIGLKAGVVNWADVVERDHVDESNALKKSNRTWETENEKKQIVLIASRNLTRRQDLLKALETKENIAIVDRDYDHITQRTGVYFEDVAVDEQTCIMLQDVTKLNEKKELELLVIKATALADKFKACWIMICSYGEDRAFGNHVSISTLEATLGVMSSRRTDWRLKVVHCSSEEQAAEIMRMICIEAHRSSPLSNTARWFDRTWILRDPSAGELFLLAAFPCLNSFSAQMMLNGCGESVRALISIEQESLTARCSQIPSTVLEAFCRIRSSRSAQCEETSQARYESSQPLEVTSQSCDEENLKASRQGLDLEINDRSPIYEEMENRSFPVSDPVLDDEDSPDRVSLYSDEPDAAGCVMRRANDNSDEEELRNFEDEDMAYSSSQPMNEFQRAIFECQGVESRVRFPSSCTVRDTNLACYDILSQTSSADAGTLQYANTGNQFDPRSIASENFPDGSAMTRRKQSDLSGVLKMSSALSHIAKPNLSQTREIACIMPCVRRPEAYRSESAGSQTTSDGRSSAGITQRRMGPGTPYVRSSRSSEAQIGGDRRRQSSAAMQDWTSTTPLRPDGRDDLEVHRMTTGCDIASSGRRVGVGSSSVASSTSRLEASIARRCDVSTQRRFDIDLPSCYPTMACSSAQSGSVKATTNQQHLSRANGRISFHDNVSRHHPNSTNRHATPSMQGYPKNWNSLADSGYGTTPGTMSMSGKRRSDCDSGACGSGMVLKKSKLTFERDGLLKGGQTKLKFV